MSALRKTDGIDREDCIVPNVIAWRIDEPARPLVAKWRRQNPGVSWRRLLRRAVLEQLRPLAGKRLQNLYL